MHTKISTRTTVGANIFHRQVVALVIAAYSVSKTLIKTRYLKIRDGRALGAVKVPVRRAYSVIPVRGINSADAADEPLLLKSVQIIIDRCQRNSRHTALRHSKYFVSRKVTARSTEKLENQGSLSCHNRPPFLEF